MCENTKQLVRCNRWISGRVIYYRTAEFRQDNNNKGVDRKFRIEKEFCKDDSENFDGEAEVAVT